MYLEYLDSVQMKNIVSGKEETTVGHTILREICNHPDLKQVLFYTSLTQERKFNSVISF